ncbi:hypothetical protein C8R41DRAFT_592277 [Lentinula lateritia]|uniref:Uncharacterized protein n=1 Tax=Lentinula lateritia TaxID=40482 RepID=A0ABQ8V481_9AGAR|nr:hypothetical protein C8R41DRAFT_592277 [Lentinula lateritia]
MHLNPTYLFLGFVSAALSISSTCAVPLNASPEDSLATRAPVQSIVPVNAGPVGSLVMRAVTAMPEVRVQFYGWRRGVNIDEKAIEAEVEQVVKGYLAKLGLPEEVSIQVLTWPRNNDVERFDVTGPGVEGKQMWFERVGSTSTTRSWEALGTSGTLETTWEVAA